MLLQSLRALCKAPRGAGSIWKYLEALVRATGGSGRFAYGFRTELHFADVVHCVSITSDSSDAVRCRVLLPMLANSLSVYREVNVIDD